MATPAADPETQRRRWVWLRVFWLCFAAFSCTASGRITYPDDEIVFRTAESVYREGSFAIEAMDRRTGERKDRPDGSFGVAPGRDGQTYGFFGYALPVITAPAVALGDRWVETHPDWRHAIRGDIFAFYDRSVRGDLRRMAVTLANVPISALAIVCFGLWLSALGFALRTAVFTSLAFGLGTCFWAYTSTYLSEPLSTLMLCAAAWQIREWHLARAQGETGTRPLAIAASLVGWSVHAHLLNLFAAPCLMAYALWPSLAGGRWREEKRAWTIALALGALGFVALGLLNAWRFGSPFESGRYDHYGVWTWPFEALGAFTLGPGRSIFVFAPPIGLGLIWGRELWRRMPLEAKLAVALLLTRALFVATRSDWHGGWGLGPRYLLPVLPFALLPLAWAFEHAERTRRRILVSATLVFGLVSAYMAYHSIFEHMFMLANAHGRAHYYGVSHWSPSATPLAGFWRIDAPMRRLLLEQGPGAALGAARVDALSFGALRLGLVLKDWTLFIWMLALGLSGLWAGGRLGWSLRREASAPLASAAES